MLREQMRRIYCNLNLEMREVGKAARQEREEEEEKEEKKEEE